MNIQEMKDENEGPFTKGPCDVSNDSKKRKTLFNSVSYNYNMILVIIIVATSKSGGEENNAKEKSFQPKDTNLIIWKI